MSSATSVRLMSEGPIGRQLARMTLPLACGTLATMGAQVLIIGYVGALGVPELAAASFTFPVAMVLISLGIGLAAGTSAVVARDLGARHQGSAARIGTDAVLLAAAVTSLLAVLGVLTIEPLFRLLGASAALRPLIADYMRIWYASVPFFITAMVGLSVVRASGDAAYQGIVTIAAAVLSVVMAPLLMFGALGWHGQGLRGAALANALPWAALLAAALTRMRHFHMLQASLPTRAQFAHSLSRVLRIGAPAAATNTIIPLAAAIITRMLAQFGPVAVAGFGVATRLEGLAMVAYLALSAVINPFVGQNAGAAQPARIQAAVRLLVTFCLVSGAALAVLLYAGAPWIVSLLTRDPQVAHIAVYYLRIVPVSYGAAGIIMSVNAAFNGLSRPAAAVVVSTARVIGVNIPVASLGAWLFGAPGVFAGICLANIIVAAAGVAWLERAIGEVHAARE
jgi:MATE family, multidrug efflux pump